VGFCSLVSCEIFMNDSKMDVKKREVWIGGEGFMAKAEYKSAIRSKKLINNALADLLQEKPLDKITVTDVVRRAEINRGTFYAHYTDISDVMNHLIEQTFLRIRDAISEAPNALTEVPKVLLLKVQEILEEDMEFYQKVLNSNVSAVMQDRLIDFVLEYLFEHEEDFSFGSHEQYVLTVRFCAGGLSNLYREWFAGKLPLTLDELTEAASMMIKKII